jgi:hypothetical protein
LETIVVPESLSDPAPLKIPSLATGAGGAVASKDYNGEAPNGTKAVGADGLLVLDR